MPKTFQARPAAAASQNHTGALPVALSTMIASFEKIQRTLIIQK
jgi:hypothetical protein